MAIKQKKWEEIRLTDKKGEKNNSVKYPRPTDMQSNGSNYPVPSILLWQGIHQHSTVIFTIFTYAHAIGGEH